MPSATLAPEDYEVKSLANEFAHIKADQTGETNTFTAIVSVFDVPDKIGDITRKGAFTRTLAAFKASGRVIPVVWSHGMGTPDYYVGSVLEAKELAPGDDLLPENIREFGGLWVKGDFDPDPTAQKVYRLMKGARINEFSFGYTIKTSQPLTHDGKNYRELLDLDLWEIGPTIRGLHPATSSTSVKSRIGAVESTPVEDTSTPVSLAIAAARLRMLS